MSTYVEMSLSDPDSPHDVPFLEARYDVVQEDGMLVPLSEMVRVITDALLDQDAEDFALCLTVRRSADSPVA